MSEEETLFEFPCQFPIKAMGKNTVSFHSDVLEIVSLHVECIDDASVKTRLSSGDKFLSVTITIEATSKKQLDAIYQGLTDHPDVLMSL
jgi:putative lipoic acid-binding regulatory protein